MITSKEAAQYVKDIYNPINEDSFDRIVKTKYITCGIAKKGNTTIFSFPGTESNVDFMIDLKSVMGLSYTYCGLVVDSFYEGMEDISNAMTKELMAAKEIAITGHSLGCSHAIYLASVCLNAGIKVSSLDLFAPPLSTNANSVSKLLYNIARVRAYINGNDPIPFFPIDDRLYQFPVTRMNVSPGWWKRWFPIEWHKMDLYLKGMI